MPVGHTHQRTGVETEEKESLVLELEAFAAKDFSESGAAGVAPFRFMVAKGYVVGYFQQVKARFHFFHGGTVAFFGQVARHQDKVDTVGGINLCHGTQQVLCGIRIVRGQMNVRQLGKTECPLLCLHPQGEQASHQDNY